MLGRTHILGGALLAGYVHHALGSGSSFVVPMALGAVMSLIPDLDQRHKPGFHVRQIVQMMITVLAGVVLAAVFYPVEGWYDRGVTLGLLVPVAVLTFLMVWIGVAPLCIQVDVKHRGITHSLIGWLVFAFMMEALVYGGGMVGLAAIPSSWRLAMDMGYASHILLDMCTVEGVQLLYPIRRFLHVPIIPRCSTGSGREIFWQGLLTGGLGLLIAHLIL